VQGIASMCQDLGARVVAECIETAAELDASIRAGCDLGQGYVFAKPASPPPQFVWPAGAGTAAPP
jgi:diguanylate cyclase